MNNEFEDFNDIENVIVERKRNPFKITQLKLEHYYLNSGDCDAGTPISTSIELKSNYNIEKDELEWTKFISHTYISFNDYKENTTDSYEMKIDNSSSLIEEIEKYDLRDLKNNYYTEEEPDSLTHWELNYNNSFKIVGTYDQEILEYKKISELLEFKKIIKEEINKVQEKLRNNE